jgi:hypothetical protein
MGEADNRPLRYGAVFRASRAEAKDESTRAARTEKEQA